jgi:hypothetical protein
MNCTTSKRLGVVGRIVPLLQCSKAPSVVSGCLHACVSMSLRLCHGASGNVTRGSYFQPGLNRSFSGRAFHPRGYPHR